MKKIKKLNIKKYLILLSLFLLSCNKNSDKKKDNDLLATNEAEKQLTIAQNAELSNSLKKTKIDKSLSILSSSKNSIKTRDLLAKIIYEYYYIQDYEGINKASGRLLNYSLQSKDSINLGLAYRSRGVYFDKINVLDSSFIYYLKAEKLYALKKDKVNYANVLFNKAIVQYSIGDNLGSDLTLNQCITLFRELNNNEKTYEALIMLGNVSDELKEYPKSIYYFTKALDLSKSLEKNEIKNRPSSCYNNLGFIYMKLKNYRNAIKNFEKGLNTKTLEQNKPILYANLIDNLAISKLKIKDTIDVKSMLFKSYKIRINNNSNSDIIRSLIHLSQYYNYSGDISNSIKYAKKALDLSKSSKTKIPLDILASLQQLSDVDVKNSSKYSNEYIKISDSLQIAERNSKDRFAKIQFQTDEIKQENQGLAEKNRNLLYVFVVTFILVVLLFVVRAQRARTRELLYKQAQQKANEDIYNLMMSQQAIIDESRSKEKKRLAQDLHDGVLGRMFGLRLNLDSLNSSTDEEAVQKRFELLNELKTIEQDIREISHDLNREKQVLINNFVSIVHNLLEEQKNAFDAEVNYTIDNTVNWDKIGNAIKINLYRILQEGLQNINKYANAKNISVEIKGDEENVYLKIKDDGVGFDVNRKSKGIGMQNMISRTHDCKGIIDITSKKDEGTKIVITIPIETKQPTTIPQE